MAGGEFQDRVSVCLGEVDVVVVTAGEEKNGVDRVGCVDRVGSLGVGHWRFVR